MPLEVAPIGPHPQGEPNSSVICPPGLALQPARVPLDVHGKRLYVAFGSAHTEAIVTRDDSAARRFIDEVDSSTVLINASTRFADGGELGLGAEIGISTSKLHAFGPMGAANLTAKKWIVYGEGQVRG